ncbi:AraC family transcriptional regulator [Paenibacillus chondroitinus]|uniref:AraC family transcriptional regulator n=1 Tax=Paenibacillus chondroitinus TaxID=59842 RepID=A0ABU6DEZ9_9BACL|nr:MULTISPECIES: AraC family transcriptional regulator [Paenibacillus]MCY9659911.1 AraC family transcriptional regulator [Paenibacillus anseongense]MEB4795471.1 AraC family transcriptional regulator [Paenibacillus chondroitinus]
MRKPYYRRKEWIIAMLSACLPAAIIGIILYVLGTQQIEKEAQKAHQNQVSYAIERINENLNHLELIMAQWSFNLNLGSSFSELDVYENFKSTRSIYQALTWIKSSDPLIGEVTLYLDKQQMLINENTGIHVISSTDELEVYRTLASYQRDVYWTNQLSANSEMAPFSLIVRIPGGLVQTEAALIVEINAKKLNALISELDADGTGATVLLQQDGGIISLGQDSIARPTDLDLTLMRLVDSGGGTEQSSSIQTWNSEAYSVSVGQMKRIGHLWTIASATPLDQMTKPVQRLSRIIMLTGCLGIFLALMLSWYSYQRMYNPINRLIQQLKPGRSGGGLDEFDYIADEWKHLSRESQILQARIDQHLPSLRENFLLQLMQGNLSLLSESELAERVEQLGWEADDRVYAVLVLQIHGIYRSEGKFSPGDEPLVSFAAMNIVQELIKNKGIDGDTVNFHDLTLGVLVRQPADMSEEHSRTDLFHLAEELAHTLNSLLKVEVTVSVGGRTEELRKLAHMFDDTRNALAYRKHDEAQQILDALDIIPGGQDAIAYPFEEEAAILKALRSGNEAELVELLDHFFLMLKTGLDTELGVRQALMQLCGNIHNTIMLSGYNPLQLNDGLDMWEQLTAIREPEAIVSWIKQYIVAPYIVRLHSTQDMQLKRLVENVLSTIHTSYAHDISLEYCADVHGTYAKKLSLGFKQVTGQTFIDYLTQYRLTKAKQLLVETDEKINDIAIRVGYQPPYFNRLFKKYEGMTPGQYREKAEIHEL